MASFFRDMFGPKSRPNDQVASADQLQREIQQLKEIPLLRYKARMQRNNTRQYDPSSDELVVRFPELKKSLREHHTRLEKSPSGAVYRARNNNNNIITRQVFASDKEILSRLDPNFFTEDYDPLLTLIPQFPKKEEDLDTFLMENVTKYDQAMDVIRYQLYESVQENYPALIQGMRHVQDIDMDTTRANIHVKNGRRKLDLAKQRLVNGNLNVLKLHRARARAKDVFGRLKQVERVLEMERSMRVAFEEQLRFSHGVDVAIAIYLIVTHEHASRYGLLKRLRERMSRYLPKFREQVEKRLTDVSGAGKFEPHVYADLIFAMIALGKFDAIANSVEKGQWSEDVDLSEEKLDAIAEHIHDRIQSNLVILITMFVRNLLLEKYKNRLLAEQAPGFPLDKLCDQLPLTGKPSFVNMITRLYATVLDIIKSHSMMIQFHEDEMAREWTGDTCPVDAPKLVRQLPQQQYQRFHKLIHDGLVASKMRVWGAVVDLLKTLLGSTPAGYAGLRFTQFKVVVATTTSFVDIGQGYCEDKGSILAVRGFLRQRLKQYAFDFHVECLDVLNSFLRRESWTRICVPLKDVGGMDHLLRLHIDHAMVSRASTDAIADQCLQDKPWVLDDFLGDDNPFETLLDEWEAARKRVVTRKSESNGTNTREATAAQSPAGGQFHDDDEGLLSGDSSATDIDGDEDIEDEDNQILHDMPDGGVSTGFDESVLTSVMINCVAKSVGKYILLSKTVPGVAGEAILFMQRFFDYMVFQMFSNLVPFEEQSLLMDSRMSRFSQECHTLVQCMLQVKERTKTPQAKRKAFAHDTSVKPADASSSVPVQSSAKSLSGADALWLKSIQGKTPKMTFVPKQTVALDVVTDKQSLARRVTGAETLSFFLAMVEHIRPTIEELAPPVQKPEILQSMYARMGVVVKELQSAIYKGIARQLVDQVVRDSFTAEDAPESVTGKSKLTMAVLKIKWEHTKSLKTQSNVYVDALLRQFGRVWSQLQRDCGEGRVFPVASCARIWEFAVEEMFECLLRAFGQVTKCSTEGRALMSLDFSSLSRGLEEIHPSGERTSTSRALVDQYIKAFYYDREQDLLEWISQHKHEYEIGQIICLVECGIGSKLGKSKRKALYEKLNRML